MAAAREDDLVIRILGEADLPAFRALRLEAVTLSPTTFLTSATEEQATSDAETLRRLVDARPAATFGAFAGDSMVGMAGFGPNMREKQRHRGTLWGVYVQPEFRGKGTARSVVEATIRHARDHVEVLDAVVTAWNTKARALYASLGFREYGIIERSLLIDGVYYDDVLIALDFGRK